MPSAVNNMRIMVGPVNVPVRMDRPQIVTQASGSEVEILEYHRWAGSLKGDVGGVISSSLARTLNTPNVWNFAQSTQSQFDYQILVDVQTLESMQGGDVVVDVLWTIRPSVTNAKIYSKATSAKCMSRELMGRSIVREPLSGNSLDALLAAQSRAFSRVGNDIAKGFSGGMCDAPI